MVVTPPMETTVFKVLLKHLDQGNLTIMMLVSDVDYLDIGQGHVKHPRMLQTRTKCIVKQGRQITWNKKIKMAISI
ncbi:hypothetical protein RchiOBHm_Chr1g0383721 [Rosa chinensis]|uniref:Uncharacterized protein n=1 Tax=Rosa chinensis TaxID=74649 RepID=A0A2P6SPQ1_ROSCH|nr:hypothetical protein RchiOBHm_Chr1g0383721 [Rosa chinensis]